MFYRHLCVTCKLYGTPDRSSKQLYDWLAEYIRTISIVLRNDAGNETQVASTNSKSFGTFTRQRYIEWTEGKARTIRIVQP